MEDDVTIKVSKKTHAWLTKRKKDKGTAIRFIVDTAIEALIREEASAKKT